MQKAILLGASSGIGKELALLLSENGYMVGVVARRGDLLDEIVATDPDHIIAHSCDLTNQEQLYDCLNQLLLKLDGVDLFIICAGMGELNRALDPQLEMLTVELNVTAFTRLVDFAYNYFKSQNQGHIIAISSVMGLRGSGIAPAYSASKAYQINYLESLRQRARCESQDIIVTDIRPGSVETPMMKGEGHFWISSPQKAAAEILRAIRKRRPVYYVSRRWMVVGFLLKILPRSIYKRLGKI